MSLLENISGGEVITSKPRKHYMGMVNLQPIMFNPTKEDVIRIKGLTGAAAERERDVEYIQAFKPQNGGASQTRLSLLCSFDPNEYIKSDTKFDIEYVTIDIYISNENEVANTGSIRILNDMGNATWAASIDALKGNTNMDWFFKSNGKEVELREACVGEAMLYKLLLTIYTKVSTRNNPIRNFVLGEDPRQTMEELWNGEFDLLNNLLENDMFKDKKTGLPNRISMLLGVTVSDKTNATTGMPYLNHRLFVNIDGINKANRTLSKQANETVENGKFKAYIPAEAPYRFQEFDYAALMNAAANAEAAEPTGKVEVEEDDDLPF